MSTVEIKYVGPIERLSIPLPEKGGVVVLKGSHGSGKSTALRAVSKRLGGKAVGLSPTDGRKTGSVQIGEAKLIVGRSVSNRGELEVSEIESRIDISKLVDPGIQDVEKADAARIKALVALSGVEADATKFHELCGGKEAYLQLGVDDDTDDPVLLASRVKRSIEAASRRLEKEADTRAAEAKAMRQGMADVDETREHDEEKLRAEYDDARDSFKGLQHRKEEAARQKESKANAKEQLATVDQSAPSVDACRRLVDGLQQQLQAAKENLFRVEAQQKLIDSLTPIIEADDVKAPNVGEFQDAEKRLHDAEKSMEAGVLIRRALGEKEKAKAAADEAKRVKQLAESERAKAAAVDDVLSTLIPTDALRLKAGRLVTETDRSPNEPYSELSHGWRYRIAIDLAADHVGEGGILTVAQEAWDGMSNQFREEINGHAIARGVIIFTAQIDENEIRAELFE